MRAIKVTDKTVILELDSRIETIESSSDNVISNESTKITVVDHQIQSGPPGMSAYQMALNEGFVGTEEEWLKSLSAYGIALDNGFVGTEEEWLDSLRSEVEVTEEDEGKVYTNDGISPRWEDLETLLNSSDIEWDMGEFE